MSSRVLAVACLAIVFTCAVSARADRPPTGGDALPRAWLYTVGRGSDFMSYYGHSAVCIETSRWPDGRCYDYGVATGSAAGVILDSIRGRPRFFPVAVSRPILEDVYKGQERTIWRQELPLSPEAVTRLAVGLESAVAAGKPYWYHPYYDNCTTRMRDAIDAVASGKLHADSGGPEAERFRTLSEGGFKGHALELAGLALFLGAPTDKTPSAWEGMFLPERLRDAVEARLGAPPELVYERRELVLPTSVFAGRAALGVLAVVLGAVVAWASRRGGLRLRVAAGAVALALALLGVALEVVAGVSSYPELSRNWSLLVLLPSDAVLAAPLPWVRSWVGRYLGLRLSGLALLAVASLAGIVQPLVAVCLLAAAPLGAIYLVRGRLTS